MNLEKMRLTDLPLGKTGQVLELNAEGLLRNRLLDLGLVPETVVEAVRRSPVGDPVAFRIRGALMALRSEESGLVTIRPI